MVLTDEELLLKAKEFNKLQKLNLNAVRKIIRIDELHRDELEIMIDFYDPYIVGKEYILGDRFKYEGNLYEVIVPGKHTSQSDWIPSKEKAMYKSFAPEGVIPNWVAPTGGHDAYKNGDKVIYKDEVWVSKIPANTTVPDGDVPHNRYWEKDK